MDKACAKVFIHEDSTGSSIHSCFIKKCKRRPTVFLRTVREGSKEEWIPTCRVHTSQVAGLVVAALLVMKKDDDPNQTRLFDGAEEGQ